MDGWTNGPMIRRTDGRTDGRTARRPVRRHLAAVAARLHFLNEVLDDALLAELTPRVGQGQRPRQPHPPQGGARPHAEQGMTAVEEPRCTTQVRGHKGGVIRVGRVTKGVGGGGGYQVG